MAKKKRNSSTPHKARKTSANKSKKASAKTTKKSTTKTSKNDIYNPLQNLSGADLKRMAEAITRAQTSGGLRAANEQISSLQRNRDTDVGNLTRLGDQATGNVSSYYRSLAKAEAENHARQQALGAKLGTDVNQSGATAAQNIANTGQAANAQLQQPSSARDELQAMIAAQSGRQSREQQALSAQASGQGAGFSALSQAMAQSNQTRGATNVSNIARQTLGGVQKTQQTYGEDIRKAIADRAGISLDAADKLLANLSDLTAAERQYSLGQGALGQKSSYQQFAQGQQRVSGKQAAKSRQGQKKLAGIYNKNKQQQQAQSLAGQLQVQQGYGGGSGSGGGTDLSDPYSGVQRAMDLLHVHKTDTPQVVAQKSKRYVAALVNRGISHKAAKVAVRKFTKPVRRQHRQAMKTGHKLNPFG